MIKTWQRITGLFFIFNGRNVAKLCPVEPPTPTAIRTIGIQTRTTCLSVSLAQNLGDYLLKLYFFETLIFFEAFLKLEQTLYLFGRRSVSIEPLVLHFFTFF